METELGRRGVHDGTWGAQGGQGQDLGCTSMFIPPILFLWGHKGPDISPLVFREARAMRVQDAAKLALWRPREGGGIDL